MQLGYILSVPTTWTSGIYLAVLTNAQGYQNYIVFVVRDDNRVAPLLYQQSVATYQAYNNYPNDGTGKSLYDYNSSGPATVSGGPRAVKVSFDRPYSSWVGSGLFFEWELYFVRWLERSGYDVTYSTDVDTHANGGALLNYKGFLSVGHDEYWSKPMRDAAEAARDAGVNVAFFGADAVDWQVRFEASSSSGAANRVMVCYRDATKDPVQGATTTVEWRQPPVNRPEQTLIAIRYASQTQNQGYFSYTVTNSGHWIYAGSGFRDGDSVPGILGYETDHQWSIDPLPNYVAGSYMLLSRSPYTNYSGQPDWANSSIYKAPSGAWVFAAGTIAWSWGLDNYGSHTISDSRIQQTTANLLNQFISSGGGLAGIAAPSNLTARATSITGINLAWTDNSSNKQNFVIERSTDQVNWSIVTSTWPANNTTYNDTVPSAGVYSYRVKATNTVTNSSYSNTATVDTHLLAPTGLSVMSPPSARVDLNWIDNATNETAYTVERSPDGSASWTILSSTLPANTTSYSDTSVSSLATYYYRVKATNGTNSSGYSNIVSVGTTNNVPPGSVLIYDEGLSPGWADWSYNINRDFNHTDAFAFSGSVDLQAQARAAWGAIALHFNGGNFNTFGFSTINFALEASVANQPIAIFFDNGSIALKQVDIRNYGGVVQNGWKVYSIPLSDLAAANTNIQNLNFQDWTGQTSNFPTFWLDKIYFSAGSTSPPPPLPISTSPPPLANL